MAQKTVYIVTGHYGGCMTPDNECATRRQAIKRLKELQDDDFTVIVKRVTTITNDVTASLMQDCERR